MIRTERREIGGKTYEVRQFGAKQGRQVLFRLSRMLSPVMAGLVGGLGSGDASALHGALAAWAEGAKLEDFEHLCEQFAGCTKYVQRTTTGAEVPLDLDRVFDEHFAGEYGDMVLWLAFAVEVNYARFLAQLTEGLGPRLAALGIHRRSESESPTGSTGSSGG